MEWGKDRIPPDPADTGTYGTGTQHTSQAFYILHVADEYKKKNNDQQS